MTKCEKYLKHQFKKNKITPNLLAYIVADLDGEVTEYDRRCKDCILDKRVPNEFFSNLKDDSLCEILYHLGEFIGDL